MPNEAIAIMKVEDSAPGVYPAHIRVSIGVAVADRSMLDRVVERVIQTEFEKVKHLN